MHKHITMYSILYERQEDKMAQNILQEVQKRMQDMTSKKAADLEAIRAKQTEAQQKKEAAESALKAATEEMNLEKFKAAEKQKHDAQTAIAMYSGRFEQIQQQEYISEKESDEVIDSLLQFEEDLAADFKAALTEKLQDLEQLHREYSDTVRDAEQTILTWTTTIHSNHRSRGLTLYADGTDRSPKPIPVRNVAYAGCEEAKQLQEYLTQASKLYKG